MLNVREQSTHLARSDRRMGDDWLETWLEDWGVAVNTPIQELASPMKTSLKVAEELRPEKMQLKVPDYWGENGELLPLAVRAMIYNLLNMWKKKTAKTSSKAVPRVPRYFVHHRIAKLNKAIGLLPDIYRLAIVYRYERGWSWQVVLKETGVKQTTYHKRLRKAKEKLHILLKSVL